MPASPSASRDSAHGSSISTASIASSEKEAVLIEMLLSGLDLRASAALVGSPMLTYLVDLLIMRTREELHAIAVSEAVSRREPESEGAA